MKLLLILTLGPLAACAAVLFLLVALLTWEQRQARAAMSRPLPPHSLTGGQPYMPERDGPI